MITVFIFLFSGVVFAEEPTAELPENCKLEVPEMSDEEYTKAFRACMDNQKNSDPFVLEAGGDDSIEENAEEKCRANVENTQRANFLRENPSEAEKWAACVQKETADKDCKGTAEKVDDKFVCRCDGVAPDAEPIARKDGKFDCEKQIASQTEKGGEDTEDGTKRGPASDDGGGQNDNGGRDNGGDEDDKDKDDEDEEDEESPFDCASGGGGGSAGQAAMQQLQRRAQMENQCNQNYEQARVKCDPDSVVGVDGMIEEAEAKAARAQKASETGLKQACEEFKKAMDAASNELRSFRGQCASQKASCISSCNQAVAVNGATNPILQMVGACSPMFGAIAAVVAQSNSKIEQVNLRSCTEFEVTLKEADRKHEELVKLMRESDLCQTQLKESCQRDSTAAHCRTLETAQKGGEDLQAVDTTVERTPKFKLNASPLGSAGASITPVDGKGKAANVKQANGATSAKLGSAGGGGSGSPRSSGGGGGYYSEYDDLYGRMKGDSFNKARRGGARGRGKSYSYKGSGRKYKRKPSSKGKSGLDLKRYLPGGSNDPRRFRHGITPANGPDIFEKVRNRYRIKKGTLIK